jgi:hypothetical protein
MGSGRESFPSKQLVEMSPGVSLIGGRERNALQGLPGHLSQAGIRGVPVSNVFSPAGRNPSNQSTLRCLVTHESWNKNAQDGNHAIARLRSLGEGTPTGGPFIVL